MIHGRRRKPCLGGRRTLVSQCGSRLVSGSEIDQYAFLPNKPDHAVKHTILISSQKLQFCRYRASRTQIALRSRVSPRHPLTCAQPVIPTFKRCRVS